MAAALTGLLGGAGVNPLAAGPITTASLQSTGMSSIQTFFKNGFPIGWFGLFILAGGIPFPPFSYLGYGGLNLWAAGSMSYFGMKGGFQAICLLASHFVSAYYPKVWWISYLMVFNPWYVFDLVQMFSPTFAKEGFKLPIYHTPIGGSGGSGTVTVGLLAAATALFSTGAYSLVSLFPPELQASYKPVMNTTLAVVGGVSAIAGGGIGSVVLIPQILAAVRGGTDTGTAPKPAPIPSLVSGPTMSGPIMSGGGNADLPSLNSVANNILNKKAQSGGGSSVDGIAANIFIGALAVTALGGISLALVRAKAVSSF